MQTQLAQTVEIVNQVAYAARPLSRYGYKPFKIVWRVATALVILPVIAPLLPIFSLMWLCYFITPDVGNATEVCK